MFDVIETGLPGCVEMQPIVRGDARGRFVKTVHADAFAEHGLRSDFVEQYYSVSDHGVVRGLHFQVPPFDHAKLVYCTDGDVFDVVVDLRKGSPTYGEHRTFTLSAKAATQLYIPAGLAHGFCVTSASATLVYNVTSVYAPDHDGGILWDSAGIDWPLDALGGMPELSERDQGFPALADFDSPFVFEA